jgi:hypothetical protein
MQTPQTAQLLLEIERRQDEVLQTLDELDSQLERALREGQAHLKLLIDTGDGSLE